MRTAELPKTAHQAPESSHILNYFLKNQKVKVLHADDLSDKVKCLVDSLLKTHHPRHSRTLTHFQGENVRN